MSNNSPLSGETILARLKDLARHTDVPGEMTRLSLSPAHRLAAQQVSEWFQSAGMTTHMDPLGSIVGRHASHRNDARTLLIGSHLDTVPNGGIYDGPMGVLIGVAVVEELVRQGKRLPFAIEVVAFSDEEGVRFPTTLSSSRGVAGRFEPACLDEKDRDGITRRDALKAFGCEPERWAEAARDPSTLIGYLEAHIEQGPVLEAEHQALGAVSAIAGCSRGSIRLTGKAGHAGTTPMALRKDALACAAEIVLAFEGLARDTDDLVATIGVLDIAGAAVNVVPGRVAMTYDIRSAADKTRVRALATVLGRAREIAAARDITIDIDMSYAAPAAVSDERLMAALDGAIRAEGGSGRVLPSGAGHDAMSFRAICPQAMLFVRCKDGLSHHPDEFATAEDIGAAARAMFGTVLRLAEQS